jgi:PKD repeat protein
MRKLSLGVLAALVVTACQDSPEAPRLSPRAVPAAATVPQQGGRPIIDEYIVVFNNDVGDPADEARQLAAAQGATIRFVYSSAVKGFAAHMSTAAANALARNPRVSLVEQDQTISLDATETLPGGEPWGLDRIDTHAGLDNTYNYTLTGAGVTAYIIDTGILTTHSEFGSRASGGFTAINDGGGTTDCNGHGTHVSGTVGGATYGVAKAVQLVAVRVLDCRGSGTTSGVIAGVDWVTGHHAGSPAVANMSLGGGASSSLDQAVANSIASGVAYAIAAGNGNMAGIAQDACNYSPARVAAAMTIGATTKTDAKTSWSNYGNCVDWFAPGNAIKSAWIGSNTATNTISGTSMATPHTTGVAALYLQANPSATPQQVRDALFAAATKGVVSSAKTTNNHLLYTPPEGFGAPPPPSNTPPTAAFSFACTDATCQFTDQSFDPDVGGSITSWSWNFGDNSAASTLQNPSHTYTASGTYTVTLTVRDNLNAPNSTSHSVNVTVPVPPGSATLQVADVSKSKGTWTVQLNWSGFAGAGAKDLYRNNAFLKPAGSGTSGTVDDTGKGGGSFTYKICEHDTPSNCTNSMTVSP